jgi:C4-dicarboxylate-specific signal transduction histidine kinase
MNTSEVHKIRPAGRHILTIGRELIQDSYAAVIELVKNAYDADSPDVNIIFSKKPESCEYTIKISDHGHGMSRDTVIDKWMVPSTRDKLDRQHSPKGRIMQGCKGIGRYAASILGNDLLLETITEEGEKTTVYVKWDMFEKAEYLDNVEILIETKKTSEPSETKLTISGNNEFLVEWDKTQFRKLEFELKKLISPISATGSTKVDNEFNIYLNTDGFSDIQTVSGLIKPFPLFDLYDYRITGIINSAGKGTLKYSIQKARNTIEEQIQFDMGRLTGCGELVFDIRVYDREKESIDSLIRRGLQDDSGNYFGNLQARQILNTYNGIGVYRNGFRIRPLGDSDFDWLKLNEHRIQNPSMRIGNNQVIGYVQIQSEEMSGLIEKSARDGLKENSSYNQLKNITKEVIGLLEERRFIYRRKAGLSRPALKIERELERIFSFDTLKTNIRTKLTKVGIKKETTEEIIDLISKEEENKEKIADEIRQTIAIYQGQATLGKIINVILHEGRKPLSYFRNQIPRIHKQVEYFKKEQSKTIVNEIIKISDGIGENADIFVNLFARLDPLAAKKRNAKQHLELKKAILDSLAIFKIELNENKIDVQVDGQETFKFLSWQQDIFAIFTNLIDNSIYWMVQKKTKASKIVISIITEGDSLVYIDYRDTGPGIESSHIESEIIFEPWFSTKAIGTGLGLAIAGESASRNGLELKAFESDTGAYFRLQPKMENYNE